MVRQIARSHRGKTIDMGAIKAKNGQVRAAGNAKMNARGDLLGPGGQIIKTKEQLASEYNTKNPKAVEHVESLNSSINDMLSGKTSPDIPVIAEQVVQTPKSDIDSLKKFDIGVKVEETETKK